MQDAFDIVVVGGGPAGLAAAEAAAQGGVRVAVLERQSEIGYPIHTSGGSWVADMRAIGIPAHLYHSIHHITWLSPNRQLRLTYDDPVACVLDVRGVYQFLAGRAVQAGAALYPRSPVEGPIIADGHVVGVIAKSHTGQTTRWSARIVIDASGFTSTIATKAGLHAGYRRYGYGAEYDYYAPNYNPDDLYLIMGSQVAPNGYAWIFPRGNGRVRLGIGVLRPDTEADARTYLDTFTERLPQLAPVFAGASPIEYHTGLFPSEGMTDSFVGNGFLTTGDSAGQGSTLVGEGIRFAIYSGQMAGRVAAAAVRADDPSAQFLACYEREWRERFGRAMRIAYLINKRIAAYTDDQWDNGLDLLARMTPAQIAQALRGDFTSRLLLGIARRNPTLLRTASRKFLQTILSQFASKTSGLTEAGSPT
jgi:digeranylgeranylglycerophospholipid reductase